LAKGASKFPLAEADRRCAEAILAEANAEHAVAREGYLAVLETWREHGVVLEQAYTLTGLGRCHLALGQTEDGVARLKEARAFWDEMKATPRIAEIDGLLATVSSSDWSSA
jgi:hypothetical protein